MKKSVVVETHSAGGARSRAAGPPHTRRGRWRVLFVCAILAVPAGSAAAADFGRTAPHYWAASWQTDSGLPQNSVQAIAQTRDGYLWVGTKEGLARFDGAEFTVFNEHNVGVMTNSSITALLEGPEGSLWIGTEGGGLLRLQNGRFQAFSFKAGLLSIYIESLRLGTDGSVWIGSTRGVTRFKDGHFSGYTTKQGLLSNSARVLTVDPTGAVWIGTALGVNVLRDATLTAGTPAGQRKSNSIRAMLADRAGALWIAFNSELVRLRAGTSTRYTASDGLIPNTVDRLFEDHDGTLWVGTNDGLYRFDGAGFVAETAGGALSHEAILDIAEDREGNVWLGTHDGLKQIRAQAFSAYTMAEGLAHNVVSSVLEDRKGALWIGTMGGGLNRVQDGAITVQQKATGLLSDSVLALHEGRDGSLWVGFATAGLCRLQEGKWEQYPRSTGAPPFSVTVIYEDHAGTVWFGTRSGLASFRDGKFTIYPKDFGGSGNAIRAITEDRDGVLWIGTNRGITRGKDGQFTTLTKTDGLSYNSVTALYTDRAGVLWIGTDGGGLNWMKDGRLGVCTTRQGLFNNTVLSILEDDRGNFWISSRNGVFSVPQKELAGFVQGTLPAVTCISYGKVDGLSALEGSSGSNPGAWKTHDGRLWFATTKGLQVVDPAQLRPNEIPPPVVLTGVEVDRVAMAAGAALRLPPGRGELQFTFAALSFAQPEKIRYRYRLDDGIGDWVEAGNRRVAHFNGVQPGRHRFQVIARNNDGVWNRTGATCEFYLTPHFYETWWFYGLIGVALAGALAGSYQLRTRALRRRERELAALVAERTKELRLEIAERERAEEQVAKAHRELLEVSRQAGMAEVAAGVLHNVGNVLNSVNVSATLVMDQVRDSKTANLEKVGALLREHSADLGAFFTTDPRGRKLPDYLALLATQIAAERKTVTDELAHLRQHVDHIKEIVAMQQIYARVSGVAEPVALTEVAEDALRINASALDRHGLEVVRDFTPGVSATVERHKVLQILVNLLQNAKQACDAAARPDKRVTMRIARDGERVCVSVSDNGIGIPSENLTRIFSHGFTTRKDGHGFGLHSGALAAKELGGTLVVHSDGPGQGATFTLELPFKPPGSAS